MDDPTALVGAALLVLIPAITLRATFGHRPYRQLRGTTSRRGNVILLCICGEMLFIGMFDGTLSGWADPTATAATTLVTLLAFWFARRHLGVWRIANPKGRKWTKDDLLVVIQFAMRQHWNIRLRTAGTDTVRLEVIANYRVRVDRYVVLSDGAPDDVYKLFRESPYRCDLRRGKIDAEGQPVIGVDIFPQRDGVLVTEWA